MRYFFKDKALSLLMLWMIVLISLPSSLYAADAAIQIWGHLGMPLIGALMLALDVVGAYS